MGLLRSSTRYADILMCLNSEEARYLLDHDWASRGRVTVLANHAPKAFFIERIYRGRATQLLFVGQWLPMKGTRVLVEAFTHLRRIHPDLRLCCAGTLVPNKDVLKSFPADIQDSVSVFQGVTEQELLDLHRSADIFVFPTLSEGSSLALTEAMTSGLPIVTTPVGSAPDVLTHNRSALFVPNDDADATIGALNILLDNRSLRSQLGQNAQAAADALRPEYTMHDFGVCFELLAHATQPSENVMKFRAKAVRGSE
jgi:glycosyltransferase involved in cell wall biosynthesis